MSDTSLDTIKLEAEVMNFATVQPDNSLIAKEGTDADYLNMVSIKFEPELHISDTVEETFDNAKPKEEIKYYLKDHKRHSDIEMFKCSTCDENCSSQSELHTHSISHYDSFKCDKCDGSFSTRILLREHQIVHTAKAKPYKCDQCDKSFSRPKVLNQHKFVHTGDKPYKCNECDKAFSRQDVLKRHISIVHTSVKPFKCDECEETFAQSNHLNKHILLVHTAQTKSIC